MKGTPPDAMLAAACAPRSSGSPCPPSLSASESQEDSSGRTRSSRTGAGSAPSSPRFSWPRPASTLKRRSSSLSRATLEAFRPRESRILRPPERFSCGATPRPQNGPSSRCQAGAPTARPRPAASRAWTRPAHDSTFGERLCSYGSTRRRRPIGSWRTSRRLVAPTVLAHSRSVPNRRLAPARFCTAPDSSAGYCCRRGPEGMLAFG